MGNQNSHQMSAKQLNLQLKYQIAGLAVDIQKCEQQELFHKEKAKQFLEIGKTIDARKQAHRSIHFCNLKTHKEQIKEKLEKIQGYKMNQECEDEFDSTLSQLTNKINQERKHKLIHQSAEPQIDLDYKLDETLDIMRRSSCPNLATTDGNSDQNQAAPSVKELTVDRLLQEIEQSLLETAENIAEPDTPQQT